MKKWLKASSAAMAAVLACGIFTACTDFGKDPPDQTDEDDERYTVTYDVNGGTMTSDSSVTVDAGESVTLPEASMEDAELSGWYLGTTFVGAPSELYAHHKRHAYGAVGG